MSACAQSASLCGRGGMADALASGASGGIPVKVQVLSPAPTTQYTNQQKQTKCETDAS